MGRKIGKAQLVAELRQQARQMARQAWSLLRMADDMARDEASLRQTDGELAPGPTAYEYEQLLAGMADQVLRERALRRKLFPGQIFGECGWDILLILFRNRVQGRRSVPHNVSMELDCTVREVERIVKILIDDGLAEWCDRLHFIRLSDDGALRVRSYFVDEEPVPVVGQKLVSDRQCA